MAFPKYFLHAFTLLLFIEKIGILCARKTNDSFYCTYLLKQGRHEEQELSNET